MPTPVSPPARLSCAETQKNNGEARSLSEPTDSLLLKRCKSTFDSQQVMRHHVTFLFSSLLPLIPSLALSAPFHKTRRRLVHGYGSYRTRQPQTHGTLFRKRGIETRGLSKSVPILVWHLRRYQRVVDDRMNLSTWPEG